jgi:type I restriction enzyme S subunit
MNAEAKTLEGVSLFIVDCLHSTAPTVDDGYPLIRTPNVGRGRLELDDAFRVTTDTYDIWTRRAVPQDGDLILAREAPAGNVAIIKNGHKVCLGQRTALIRPDRQAVDPDFLCYYLLAPRQQAFLLSGATGVTAAHVNMKDIRRLPLHALPDIDAQQRAGSCLAAYDDLIENNCRRMALLEGAARHLYEEWFVRLRFPGYERTRVIGGVPDGWERKHLGDLLTLKRGYDLPESERLDGEFPIVSSSGITGFHAAKKAIAPGVVTGRYGTLGEVFFIQQDYWPLNTSLYVSDFKGNHPSFVAHLLKHVLSGVQSDKAAVPGLNRNVAHQLPVLSPTRALRDQFAGVADVHYRQLHTLGTANQQLKAARDLLLPRLMSGEIGV